MKKKLFWAVVALLALTVIVLVVVRSLPITYKGLALPTPAQVGPDIVLPPAVWLIVGDKAVLASYGSSCYRAGLIFGTTGCGRICARHPPKDCPGAVTEAAVTRQDCFVADDQPGSGRQHSAGANLRGRGQCQPFIGYGHGSNNHQHDHCQCRQCDHCPE